MTEDEIYIAIEDVIVKLTGINVNHILRAYPGQRVSLPATNNYVIMTFVGDLRLSTPSANWDENNYTITQNRQGSIQLDFFGENAKKYADALVDSSRSLILCDLLEPFDIQPLYCDEARNNTSVGGEKKYVPRWTVQMEITYNTTLSVSVDTFSQVQFNIFKTEL